MSKEVHETSHREDDFDTMMGLLRNGLKGLTVLLPGKERKDIKFTCKMLKDLHKGMSVTSPKGEKATRIPDFIVIDMQSTNKNDIIVTWTPDDLFAGENE